MPPPRALAPVLTMHTEDREQGGSAAFSYGTEQPVVSKLPGATDLVVGFYNVVIYMKEISDKGWHQKERRLKTDISTAFQDYGLDVLCLSGLGQLDENLDSALDGGIYEWINNLISDGSVEQPTEIYADDQYVTIVNTSRVNILNYEMVKGFFAKEPERSFQHFRLRVRTTDETVCIINCEATTSTTWPLGPKGRMCYLNTFHEIAEDDPFIWGGNFNTGVCELWALLKEVHKRYKVSDEIAPPSVAHPAFAQRHLPIFEEHSCRTSERPVAAFARAQEACYGWKG